MCCSTRCAKSILLLLVTLATLVTIAIHCFSLVSPKTTPTGFFRSDDTPLFFRQKLNSTVLTTYSWANYIWAGIYSYQLLVLLFCWLTICLRGASDRYEKDTFYYLCDHPNFLPVGFLWWYLVGWCCHVAWILISDRVDEAGLFQVPQVCILFGVVLCLHLCLFCTYLNAARSRSVVVFDRLEDKFWCLVALVHNGVAAFMAWSVYIVFVNLATVLDYHTSMTNYTTGFLSLCILIGWNFVYYLLDLTFLDKSLRYVFTPHIVYLWAYATAFANQFILADKQWPGNVILLIVVLTLSFVAVVCKIFFIICRMHRNPILKRLIVYDIDGTTLEKRSTAA